ncbi:MAG: hypothetical protein JWQ01_4845 [Massilia sp.]|nr:hypothetical protein [Massilia sp.]
MTEADRERIFLKNEARRMFADCMLGIILACEQCDFWLARIMARK